MNKFKITIVILIVLVLFAGTDYYLNNLSDKTDLKNQNNTSSTVNAYFKVNDEVTGYKIISQIQTNQIFEKIDLNSLANIIIYKNQLKKTLTDTASASSAKTPKLPELPVKNAAPKIPGSTNVSTTDKIIYLYEIDGPKGQGSITYLKAKLQFISQINSTTETLNENASFGHNSFYFNNLNYKNTSFLLTQINDRLFAFQFDKQDSLVYDDVKTIINNLMINKS